MDTIGRIRPLLLSALVALGCASPRPPEPVHFAPVQPDLFGDGRSLTDAWADVDGDGDPDRFVGFNGTRSRLYRNDQTDGFVDIAEAAGLIVERSVRTSAWGDFDADGDPDLLLGFAGEAPITALFRNDGALGFTNVAAQQGLELSTGATRQASWVDHDGDGDLDLFLAFRNRANALFRNDGPDGFADITEETRIGDPRRTVGAIWLDIDQDGRLDVVTSNMDGDANGIWLFDGAHYSDVAAGTPVESGGRALGDEAQGSVRVCAVDANNDGRFDLSFANYGPNALLFATANRGWTDASSTPSLAVDGHYDTCAWGDFDNDGTADLYVNGTVSGGVQYRDYLYRREGSDSFLDVTPPSLLQLNASHGATWVDFDLDGDLDLALTGAAENAMHYLMENRSGSGHRSLQVRVLDANGHATMPGAEVRLYAAGTDRLLGTRLIDSGSGYDSQSDLPAHFGFVFQGPVDVAVTIARNGERHTDLLGDVDPGVFHGSLLTIRVNESGRILR